MKTINYPCLPVLTSKNRRSKRNTWISLKMFQRKKRLRSFQTSQLLIKNSKKSSWNKKSDPPQPEFSNKSSAKNKNLTKWRKFPSNLPKYQSSLQNFPNDQRPNPTLLLATQPVSKTKWKSSKNIENLLSPTPSPPSQPRSFRSSPPSLTNGKNRSNKRKKPIQNLKKDMKVSNLQIHFACE